jgi:hypothetical protein
VLQEDQRSFDGLALDGRQLQHQALSAAHGRKDLDTNRFRILAMFIKLSLYDDDIQKLLEETKGWGTRQAAGEVRPSSQEELSAQSIPSATSYMIEILRAV